MNKQIRNKEYKRTNADGSVTTVAGNCILDHIEQATANAKTYAAILANQDTSTGTVPSGALRINLENVEQLCDLLEYLLPFTSQN